MKFLFILNDPPYGTERTYNGIRLATKMIKKAETIEITIFLMGDAVFTAKSGQQTPTGFYNLERMLKGFLQSGGKVLLCGTCMDARGITEQELISGCLRSNLEELSECTFGADKVLVF